MLRAIAVRRVYTSTLNSALPLVFVAHQTMLRSTRCYARWFDGLLRRNRCWNGIGRLLNENVQTELKREGANVGGCVPQFLDAAAAILLGLLGFGSVGHKLFGKHCALGLGSAG